jgi:uncharacterized circularly permuted ATP-grasp superfamily protein
VLAADEWQHLSAGIAQRARLLNAVLADLYGPQRLIKEGLLPAELVFGHNNFLWPCQGIQPPDGTFLHLYAVDLARTPDGRWWVTADRTQAPSGAGYALENRTIVSRAFPDLYRDLQVQHLTGFFRTLQETLARQAPSDSQPPLIVLLTPGRFNESYFEHLYLARQLGYPLVEGGDLTVRDSTVFLKTLSGLRRVHAIMRRLDDDFCDPLELRTDSALGVPGLLDAARQGNVLVANALGSGVLESPGLLGFLPKINEFLFGEELLLPSIATWWCGEAPVLAEALEKLPELLIKPAFPSQSFNPVFGRDLNDAQREALAERMRARPYAYVAQELAQLSQAPVWHTVEDHLQHRAIGMRVYAVASADGYRVLPGGLTRVAAEADAEVVSMQRGGASKDTWVLGERAAGGEQWRAQRPIGAHDLVRRDPYLPSRVVENLFWFGRYCERCDNSARWLRIVLARYVDGDDPLALQAAVELGENLRLLPEEGELPERPARRLAWRRLAVEPARQPAALAVGGVPGARQVVPRELAGPGGAATRSPGAGKRKPRLRRVAGLPQPPGDVPGGAVRVCPGRHDPRRRLALSDDGPAHRAPAVSQQQPRGVPARRGGVRSGRAGMVVGTGQQQHHLPFALPGGAATDSGARPVAAG